MIIVIGPPRSGTSMMMQTLKLLGLEVAGEKFSDTNLPEGNPEGYYELSSDETTNGITSDKYKGKAVKLFAQGFLKTQERYIDKVIICHRVPNDTVKSFMKLLKLSNTIVSGTRANAKAWVDYNRIVAEAFAKECPMPVFRAGFSEMRYSKERKINELCEFLGIDASEAQKTEAINNIR